MPIAPIKLGSANTTGFTFESGSSVTTDDYGIQTCEVRTLFGDGSTVYSNIPAEGTSVASIIGTGYVPGGFLLDFFEGAPTVEYLDATVARVTFKCKRLDPLFTNRRTVSVDSIINYSNNALSQVIVFTDGLFQNNVFGFPDPTVSVKYSSTTAPSVGSGALTGLYALPGSSQTQGFPDVPDIQVPFTAPLPGGALVSYWDGTAFQSFTVPAGGSTFRYHLNFIANPRGWQLVKLRWDPVASRSFFAVEENWRNFYSFQGATFDGHTP